MCLPRQYMHAGLAPDEHYLAKPDSGLSTDHMCSQTVETNVYSRACEGRTLGSLSSAKPGSFRGHARARPIASLRTARPRAGCDERPFHAVGRRCRPARAFLGRG